MHVLVAIIIRDSGCQFALTPDTSFRGNRFEEISRGLGTLNSITVAFGSSIIEELDGEGTHIHVFILLTSCAKCLLPDPFANAPLVMYIF